MMTTIDERLEKEFRLCVINKQPQRHCFSGRDLQDKDQIDELLHVMDHSFPGQRSVQASMFSKYYARTIAGGTLCAMSLFDQAIDISLGNTAFAVDEAWTSPVVQLKNFRINEWNITMDRNEWRESVIRHIFAEHLSVVFHRLHISTGLGKKVLWANVAGYIYWYYPQWMREAQSASVKARLEDDFHYITEVAEGDVFGVNTGENPIRGQYLNARDPLNPEKTTRIRKECCLMHCLKDGSYCGTCPKLDHESRKALAMKYQKA